MLAPGGVLLVEDLRGDFVDISDRFLGTEHPRAARFDWPAFRGGLRAAGLEILEERTIIPGWAHAFLARAPRPV